LTPAEANVARLAARGFTSGSIAAQLGVAESTVVTHIQRVKRKLGVRRKSDLVNLFLDEDG
jgi:DNA-binding CsgD family transcriptional regulator